MDRTSIRWWLLAACVSLSMLGAGACSDNNAPGVEPEITNVVDNFQFQTSTLRDASGSWSYTWQNTGTAATVNQSCSITGGTATLVIKDADGTQVYSRNLAENGTFVTNAGAAGNWRIEVVFSRVTADAVNFRVQKQT